MFSVCLAPSIWLSYSKRSRRFLARWYSPCFSHRFLSSFITLEEVVVVKEGILNLLKECNELLIREEVNALLGEEDIVHPPIRLTQVLARVGGHTLGHLGGMGQLLVHRGLL